MFTLYHFVWLAISLCGIVAGALWLKKNKPDLRRVLTLACVAAVVSELIKVFCTIQLVPAADGTAMYPYLELSQLPFHLCSMQLIFIFYARFAKDGPFRTALLAFMYPAGAIGAAIALCIPTVFQEVIPVERAFTHPMGYQYFLYHTMLVLLCGYIAFSGQVEIRPKHYWTTIGFVSTLAFCSLYLNSAFAAPVYEAGQLVSVEYVTNFLFTYAPPIDIPFTQLWHWYLYVAILALLVFFFVGLCYIPVFRRAKKSKTEVP